MVDKFAQSIRLDINGTKYPFTPSDIVDGLKLTWGRDSLFEDPKKRSLSATLIVDYAAAVEMTNGSGHILGARVRVLKGSTLLFRGSIDTIEVAPVGGDQVRLDLHSVESTTWNYELSKTFNTRAATAKLLQASIDIQTGLPDVEIIDAVDPATKFIQPEQSIAVTVLQAYNALVESRPLARAIWLPDLSQVWPSYYNRNGAWVDARFTADQVAVEGWELYFEQNPLWVEFYTGGTFGEETMIKKFPVPGDAASAGTLQITNEWGVKAYKDWEVNGAKAVLAAQQTAPRKFTIAAENVSDEWMQPWETSRRFVIDRDTITGTNFYQRWEREHGGRYVPIGGTITVKHGRSTHEMTCVYA
ncbi:hypothetical protein HMPREF3153_09760 [Corynebacterium sp. HMSC06C06]|uniref:Phage tail protein n=1 Tax=Corynebacterium striatum TaxID=43770 RepID=A0ABX7DF47_CORST|nr:MULTISPECIES: hypothetical protein [Corynebacterium]OFT50501.1 hypothetical protein HMPREF3153_09760 [Corynebacterium sp. HMSC06C06]QQU76444.1 hypothetical protein I6I72_10060 [Corynebacterium striatum]